MGTSAKKGIFFYWGVTGVFLLVKNIKVSFGKGHPPHLHLKPSLYVCRRVQGSQIFKQNWIISIRSRVILILLILISSALGGGAGGWGCLGWSAIVYMSSGMFRGKESSNRIELSWLVQELLNFGVSGSLRLWGVGGGWGVPHTHVHTHAHARPHMHAHACMVNMIISCKWLPPLGESMGIPYDVIHTCMCMCVHACTCMCTCVGGTPSPPPTHIHPPPHPPGGTPRISLNSIALELIEIFQFCLKIWNLWRLLHPRVGV